MKRFKFKGKNYTWNYRKCFNNMLNVFTVIFFVIAFLLISTVEYRDMVLRGLIK